MALAIAFDDLVVEGESIGIHRQLCVLRLRFLHELNGPLPQLRVNVLIATSCIALVLVPGLLGS